jgi:hypothetical protein
MTTGQLGGLGGCLRAPLSTNSNKEETIVTGVRTCMHACIHAILMTNQQTSKQTTNKQTNQTKPNQIKSNQIKPSQAKPSKSNQIKSNHRNKPNQTKQNQAKPSQTKQKKRTHLNKLATGRCRANVSTGLAQVMHMNNADTTIPAMVICVSPCFTPCKYSADREYAVITQFRARTLKISMVVTRVHLPCRIT